MIEDFDPGAVYPLENTVQGYAWGSPSAIPELLGQPNPEGKPQAELWMGAHPKAPSRILLDGVSVSLPSLLDELPIPILGSSSVRRFGKRLPFLFKVLAAAKALSIQAHPNLQQAREGWAREQEAGIPIDSPVRNYRDDNHKPEILCALTPFWGMLGFRPVEEILSDLSAFEAPSVRALARVLRNRRGADGLRLFLKMLLEMKVDEARAMSDAVVRQCRAKQADRYQWVARLAREFSGDVGVIAPLFLNLVHLAPGQAVFQQAGELHAYLEGTGVELMANSDNVLRGGLTPKHIDVPELLRILTFRSGTVKVVPETETGDGARVYSTPTSEFRLSHVETSRLGGFHSRSDRSVEILLCVRGSGELSWRTAGGADAPAVLSVAQGSSLLVPAAVPSYTITGDAELFRADVGVETP